MTSLNVFICFVGKDEFSECHYHSRKVMVAVSGYFHWLCG